MGGRFQKPIGRQRFESRSMANEETKIKDLFLPRKATSKSILIWDQKTILASKIKLGEKLFCISARESLQVVKDKTVR